MPERRPKPFHSSVPSLLMALAFVLATLETAGSTSSLLPPRCARHASKPQQPALKTGFYLTGGWKTEACVNF